MEGNTARTPKKLPGHRSPHTYSNNRGLEIKDQGLNKQNVKVINNNEEEEFF